MRRMARRALSASREAVLQALVEQQEPSSLAGLRAVTGLHANTLREHLDALIDAGLVRREQSPAAGRGRPAWLYGAIPEDELPTGVAEYAGLASALAEVIDQVSNAPRQDAIQAGQRWGARLAAEGAAGAGGAASGPQQVVRLLDGLGFAPQPDARHEVVRLTRCPLLEAASRYPDIVCGVHLGLVRGALEAYGGDAGGVDLLPFNEPGACTLALPRPHDREQRP